MPKTSMEKDELLQELAYLDQAEYIDKQAYAQLVKIVEQHFSEPTRATVKLMAVNTVVKMINAMPKDERKELKSKLFPEQSTEPVKDTAQKTVEQAGEVDKERAMLRILNRWEMDDMYPVRELIKDTKQLLTQKRVVSMKWIEKKADYFIDNVIDWDTKE